MLWFHSLQKKEEIELQERSWNHLNLTTTEMNQAQEQLKAGEAL